MCNTTKQKIAATMREMMGKKAFDKITVKNLMDVTCMQRQSFYYHFQDTRDVLMWICHSELFMPLQESKLDFSEWMLYALSLLDRDRIFYRRVIDAAHTDFIRHFEDTVISPRVRALMYCNVPALDDYQHFTVNFFSNAVMSYFLRFTESHRKLDLPDTRKKLQYLVGEICKA